MSLTGRTAAQVTIPLTMRGVLRGGGSDRALLAPGGCLRNVSGDTRQ
jgi:hypothetical protein